MNINLLSNNSRLYLKLWYNKQMIIPWLKPFHCSSCYLIRIALLQAEPLLQFQVFCSIKKKVYRLNCFLINKNICKVWCCHHHFFTLDMQFSLSVFQHIALTRSAKKLSFNISFQPTETNKRTKPSESKTSAAKKRKREPLASKTAAKRQRWVTNHHLMSCLNAFF